MKIPPARLPDGLAALAMPGAEEIPAARFIEARPGPAAGHDQAEQSVRHVLPDMCKFRLFFRIET